MKCYIFLFSPAPKATNTAWRSTSKQRYTASSTPAEVAAHSDASSKLGTVTTGIQIDVLPRKVSKLSVSPKLVRGLLLFVVRGSVLLVGCAYGAVHSRVCWGGGYGDTFLRIQTTEAQLATPSKMGRKPCFGIYLVRKINNKSKPKHIPPPPPRGRE